MMMPDDHKIAAEALYAVLSKPPKFENPPQPSGEPVTVGGQWDVRVDFLLGSANHHVILEQTGGKLVGTHTTETLTGSLRGGVEANQVRFSSSQRIQGQVLHYQFTGTCDGGSMQGTVNLGEYGEAKWSARRHNYA